MKYVFFILLIGLTYSLSSFNSTGRAEEDDAGNTGAPWEDGTVCANCHLGGPYGPVTESMKLIDAFTGNEEVTYIPGRLYHVEVIVEPTINASRYGFQATALDVDTLDAGIWMNTSNVVQIDTAFVSGGTGKRAYVEHHVPGFVPTFKIDWRAPLCDIGPVTFYFIGNAVNNDGSTSGDVGSLGSQRTFQSHLPPTLSLDSTAIPSGVYLVEDSVDIRGQIFPLNFVTLGAPGGVTASEIQVDSNATLEVFLSNCFE